MELMLVHLLWFLCSDTDYQSLLENLLERVKDKEPSIRVQAISALSKLQNPEELNDGSLDYGTVDFDEEQDDDEERQDTPTKVLLRLMQYDPVAWVSFPFFLQSTPFLNADVDM